MDWEQLDIIAEKLEWLNKLYIWPWAIEGFLFLESPIRMIISKRYLSSLVLHIRKSIQYVKLNKIPAKVNSSSNINQQYSICCIIGSKKFVLVVIAHNVLTNTQYNIHDIYCNYQFVINLIWFDSIAVLQVHVCLQYENYESSDMWQ